MRTLVLALVLPAMLLICGCVKPGPAPKLMLLCGGSFAAPSEELAANFERDTGVPVELSYGQSEELLPRVKIGEQGDLFITHDPFLDYVREAGVLSDSVHVGYVAPVIVVRKGNPQQISSLEDLAKPGIKVALPDADFSTCGEMLMDLLEKKGIKEQVLANAAGAIFRSHSETGAILKLGHRDVGVMWNGTAHNFVDDLEIVPTPYEYEETIRVWVMGLNYTKKKKEVEQFLDYAKKNASPIFAKYGYTK